jgi:membrane associated rhomboid family serine protease
MKRSGGRPNSTGMALETSAIIVLVMFAMFYIDVFMGGRLNFFGIFPRTLWGLLGIVFSPLLHYSLAHLTANAASLFVLLFILFSHRDYKGDQTLIWIWVLSGLGTWIIGRKAVHIGASSIIYGLVVYMIAAAFWLRTWTTAFTGVLILIFYGGIVYGMLPQPGIISWEGHLSGAISGWWVARRQHS